MNRKDKTILAVYAGIVLACLVPAACWCFGESLRPDSLWVKYLVALLAIPSAPLMMVLGFHPSKILVMVVTPVYLAFLFWPLPLIAFRPDSLRISCVRNVVIVYTILFLIGCAMVLAFIYAASGGRS